MGAKEAVVVQTNRTECHIGHYQPYRLIQQEPLMGVKYATIGSFDLRTPQLVWIIFGIFLRTRTLLWMDEIHSHHFETVGNPLFVDIHRGIITPVRWYRISSIHSNTHFIHRSPLENKWPWVQSQIVPPANIPIPTKIGSKMGGEFTYPPKWDPKTVLTTTAKWSDPPPHPR